MNEQLIREFWEGLQAYLRDFEKRTDFKPLPSVQIPEAMWTIMEAAGAPRDGWKVEMAWQFLPISQFDPPSRQGEDPT